ncbi:hypothetical protein H0H93_012067, partial [Arthromyces matolae]
MDKLLGGKPGPPLRVMRSIDAAFLTMKIFFPTDATNNMPGSTNDLLVREVLMRDMLDRISWKADERNKQQAQHRS